jgi:hypothetical protein
VITTAATLSTRMVPLELANAVLAARQTGGG